MSEAKVVLTERELAAELGLSPWTIRRWRLEAGLPHIQIGRRILYNFASVSQWLQGREVASVQPKLGDCGKLRQID